MLLESCCFGGFGSLVAEDVKATSGRIVPELSRPLMNAEQVSDDGICARATLKGRGDFLVTYSFKNINRASTM